MKFCTALASFFIIGLATASSSLAQSATVIISKTQGDSYTYSNLSGFSITNDGTMSYDGPLNQLRDSPCCVSAVLVVGDQVYEYGPSRFEKDTGLATNLNGGNTLSRELDKAVIDTPMPNNHAAVQYSLFIGGVRGGKAASSLTIQEKVDGQSLSIFPQFSPSVFP